METSTCPSAHRSLHICVFCSSSDFIPDTYKRAAVELGEAMASAGHHLVFGGGNNGLMGVLAAVLKRRGRRVVGVIPQTLADRGFAFDGCDELIVTPTLRERKHIMQQRADAFVALPGGVGTFEEFLETVALKQLGYHNKPIAVLNTNGYFDPLFAQMERSVAQGFATRDVLALYHVAETPSDALYHIESHCCQLRSPRPSSRSAD